MTLNPQARRPARVLGLAGLIPFVGLTLALLAGFDAPRTLALSQLAYAATILSFVGALHWGLALAAPQLDEAAQWRALGWGVLPALIAWCALLVPLPTGLWLMAALVPACAWMDAQLARQLGLAPWYLRLRLLLSAVVAPCLALSALAV